MSTGLRDITVIGRISKVFEYFTVLMDDGTEYKLSAVRPWEAVSPDYDSNRFARNLGRRMVVTGITDGSTIWNAHLYKTNGGTEPTDSLL